MLKRFALLMTVCAVAGCSEPEPVDIGEIAADAGLSEDEYTVHDDGSIEIHATDVAESKADDTKILWYQDDLSEPIENVGMSDGDAIIASAGLKPAKVEESVDHEGEPKKLYTISDDSPVSAWISHSPNNISLNWYQYPSEQDIELSQQSLKDAYKLARAMAGKEGADAVMYISNGGKYRSKPIGGYPATGKCNKGICFINIELGG